MIVRLSSIKTSPQYELYFVMKTDKKAVSILDI